MKVTVDASRCQGHGRCYQTAPDLFEDDDEGYGSVRGSGVVPEERRAAAEAAVRQCPERAVEFTE